MRTAGRPRRSLAEIGGRRLLRVCLEPDVAGAVPVRDVAALRRLRHVELDRAWMEDALAGADAERAAGRDSTRLGLLAVLVAPDVRARRPTGHEVITVWILDLPHVLPLDRVLSRARDQVREVVHRGGQRHYLSVRIEMG